MGTRLQNELHGARRERRKGCEQRKGPRRRHQNCNRTPATRLRFLGRLKTNGREQHHSTTTYEEKDSMRLLRPPCQIFSGEMFSYFRRNVFVFSRRNANVFVSPADDRSPLRLAHHDSGTFEVHPLVESSRLPTVSVRVVNQLELPEFWWSRGFETFFFCAARGGRGGSRG